MSRRVESTVSVPPGRTRNLSEYSYAKMTTVCRQRMNIFFEPVSSGSYY